MMGLGLRIACYVHAKKLDFAVPFFTYQQQYGIHINLLLLKSFLSNLIMLIEVPVKILTTVCVDSKLQSYSLLQS